MIWLVDYEDCVECSKDCEVVDDGSAVSGGVDAG